MMHNTLFINKSFPYLDVSIISQCGAKVKMIIDIYKKIWYN